MDKIETQQHQSELLQNNVFKKKRNKIFQIVTIILLIFLAFSRWIPGGEELDPSTSVRGYIEILIIILTLLITIFLWGFRPFLGGLRSSSFLFLFLFGLWALVSAIWSDNFILAAGKSFNLIIITFLAAGIAYKAYQQKIQIYKPIFFALILLLCIQFVNNILIYNEIFPFRLIGGRLRLVLGYDHPNTSASYYSTLVIFSIFFILNTRKHLKKIFLLLFALFFLLLLSLTTSRTDLIGVLISSTILIILSIKNSHLRWLTITSVSIIFFCSVSLLLSDVFSPRFQEYLRNNPDILTLNGRLNLWHKVLSDMQWNRIIGEGYYSSRYIAIKNMGIAWASNMHNSVIEVLVTTGLIGLIIVSIFLLDSIIHLISNKIGIEFIYFFYMIIIGITETRMFIPNIPMFIMCILVFFSQIQKSYKIQLGYNYD